MVMTVSCGALTIYVCPHIDCFQHPDDADDAVRARYTLFAEHIEDIADVYPGAQRVGAHHAVPAVFELIEGVVVRPKGREPML
jgi:hypothetical protein